MSPRFAVEFAEAPKKGCAFVLRSIFPFFKLNDRKEEVSRKSAKSKGRTARRFVFWSLVVWICAVFCLCYLVLSLASHSILTPSVKKYDGVDAEMIMKMKLKKPIVGNHYPIVIICKHIVEIAILHYICGNLMEPMTEIYEQRFVDTDQMGDLGVIQGLINLWYRFFHGFKARRRWLQPFIADTLLLLLVGLSGLLHNIDMWRRKTKLESDIDCGESHSHGGFCSNRLLVSIHTVSACYIGIIMIGFVVTTLSRNIAPIPSRRNEFNVMITLTIILWSVEFLIITVNRNIYTSMWSHAKSYERLVAAGAQIFVTHGAAMLGAIRLGHTCHFRKCPDLTWLRFGTRMVPTLVAIGCLAWLSAERRYLHDWSLAYHTQYNWLVAPQPYVAVAWSFFGGIILVVLAHRNSVISHAEGHEDDEDLEFGHILDYDLVLIAITFSFAVFYNVVMIFSEFAEHDTKQSYFSFAATILHMLAPAGIVVFTTSVWRHPPKKGTMAHNGVWFALIFCASQFIHFQTLEDCHISSNLPACCTYPSVVETSETKTMCDKSERCLKKTDMSITYVNGTEQTHGLYCALGHGHGHEHHDQSHKETAFVDSDVYMNSNSHSLEYQKHHRRLGIPFDYGDCCCCKKGKFNKRFCQNYQVDSNPCPPYSPTVNHSSISTACIEELQCRWRVFTQIGGASKESAAHKEEETVSFQLFETVGMAATVEMYFTIIGIILKVIFMTQHPNSDKIILMDSHHHHADHATGASFVEQRSTYGSRVFRRTQTQSFIQQSFIDEGSPTLTHSIQRDRQISEQSRADSRVEMGNISLSIVSDPTGTK